MITRQKVAAFFGTLMISTIATAATLTDINPSIGVDYETTLMQSRHNWRNIFPKKFQGGSVHVGSRFLDYFGLELGYDATGNKTKNSLFPVVSTKVRLYGWHIDFIGFYPFCKDFELLGTLGLGVLKPKISINNSLFNLIGNTLYIKSRTTFRAGLGVQYKVNDMVGIRGLLRWKNTSQFKLSGSSAFENAANTLEIARKPFKDALSIALGFYVNID